MTRQMDNGAPDGIQYQTFEKSLIKTLMRRPGWDLNPRPPA